MNYKGWIVAKESDKNTLEELGIDLGTFEEGAFQNCTADEVSMALLDQYWGDFYWHMVPDDWPRKIVEKCNNVHKSKNGMETTILTNSARQDKLLHLQKQCYMGCGLCEAEAMEFLENKGRR